MTNNNKSILIFGGTGGIGSRTAQKFIDSGWKVILASRGNREAEQAVSQNSDVVLETVDAANESEVEELFAKHSDSNINAIVNCVGSIYLKPLHITSIDDWNNVITTNLTTSFIILKYGIKYFRTHKIKGSFVFSSTAATHIGLMNHEVIGAAKAGVEGLVRSAAASLASQQIRVNSVAPGLVDTPLASGITGNESALKASQSLHSLGRIGQPEDIASAISWLITEATWMTGQTLVVDGGLSSIKK